MEKFCNGRVLVQQKRHSRRPIKSKNKQHTKEITPELEKVSKNGEFSFIQLPINQKK